MQNYSSMKLELLALKWSVTEKFREYLLGAKFTVYTDNNPLSYLQTAKLGAVEQRWASQLALFDFDLKYRPGVMNRNADALSRLPGRVVYPPDGTREVLQLLLPQCLRDEVLAALHNEHGHQGCERTTHLVRERCYWPNLRKDVEQWCQRCERCVVAKAVQPKVRTFPGALLATRPLEVVALDFTVLERASDGQMY